MMRQLSESFIAKLQSDATTLCLAWEFSRLDGVKLRVTNHDRDLSISHELFKSIPMINAGQIEANSGTSPDSFYAIGTFEVAGIIESDIIIGRWDHASLKLLIVDWADTENFVNIWSGYIKGFKRSKFGFELDIIGPEHLLSNTIGRQFNRHCDARLGDERCQVDLGAAGRSFSSSIAVIDSERLIRISSQQYVFHDFIGGMVAFNSGLLNGLKFDISSIEVIDGNWQIELARPMPILPQSGDSVRVSLGCDRTFATCKTKFSNQANFRGCPHMPGEDFAFSVAK